MATKKTRKSSQSKNCKSKNVRLSGGVANGYENCGESEIRNDVYTLLGCVVPKSKIKEVIDAYWQAIQEKISQGKNVQIFSVGSFRGQRRNIKGEMTPTVKFSMSTSFKKSIIENLKSDSVFPIHKSNRTFNN